jgi:Ca-activated chloride channel family protein
MTISTLSADGKSPASVLWLGREATASLVVPAGNYAVEVADGLARTVQTVEIAAGAAARADLVLDTGRLELTATAFDGGPALDRVLYLISADDPAAPEGRREVARSTASLATFTLQAGTYYITARHGAAEHRDRVAISSGDIVKRTLVLGVGQLTVKPTIPEAAAKSGRATVTRVYEAGATKRLVGQSTAAVPAFILSAGRYRVESQMGMSNIRAEQTVDLAAGSAMTAELKLQAVEVTIAGISGSTAVAAMRDSTGRVVWRSRVGDTYTALVAPGDYVIEIDGVSSTKAVTVKPGAAMTVDIASP